MIIEDILNIFDKTQSIRATVKGTRSSWQRVVKVLSSNGVIINDTHELILELYDNGKSPEEIASLLGHNIKTVKAYLPKKRPYYNINPSENARRIKKCRENKEH